MVSLLVMVADAPPLPQHPWDGFLAGPENELAHASILSLAINDSVAAGESGDGLSPLVIHGAAGVGKSRLLLGLVGEWLNRRPASAVAHLEAEAFAAACAEAAGRRGTLGWSELRSRFRNLDLLVIEDVHHLDKAPLALEELAHTIDALHARGAKIAVSARVGPGDWREWPSRLVNRFLGGLSVRVDPPGVASRRRFVLDRARGQTLKLGADAVELLAESADGYRTLNGWLARLALAARLEGKPLDRLMAATLLERDSADGFQADRLPVETIAKAVAKRFGLPLRDLRSASRRAAVTLPRHLAMHLAREHSGLSIQKIGDYFGKRDPSTVRHAIAVSQARIESDPSHAAAVEALRRGWVVHQRGVSTND